MIVFHLYAVSIDRLMHLPPTRETHTHAHTHAVLTHGLRRGQGRGVRRVAQRKDVGVLAVLQGGLVHVDEALCV